MIASSRKIKFGNSYSLLLEDNANLKQHVNREIKEKWDLPIVGKNYFVLTPKLLPKLKTHQHMVCPHAMGKKYFLFMTTFQDKKYSVFVYRKDGTVLLVKLILKAKLFSNTLLIGELVRNSKGRWLYLVDDLYVYQGEDIRNFPFQKRYENLEHLIKTNYRIDPKAPVEIRTKAHFEYSYMKDMVDNFIPTLGYPCNGIIFKNTEHGLGESRHLAGILYEIPELKEKFGLTTAKKPNSTNTSMSDFVESSELLDSEDGSSDGHDGRDSETNLKLSKSHKAVPLMDKYAEGNMANFLKQNPSINMTNIASVNSGVSDSIEIPTKKRKTKSKTSEIDEEDVSDDSKKTKTSSKTKKTKSEKLRDYVILNIKQGDGPDIYTAHDSEGTDIGRVVIPGLAKSQMMRKMFGGMGHQHVMKCEYHQVFKKWEPIEIVKGKSTTIDTFDYVERVAEHVLEN